MVRGYAVTENAGVVRFSKFRVNADQAAQPSVTYAEFYLNIRHVFEMREAARQTDRHTDIHYRHTHRNISHLFRGRNKSKSIRI